MTKHTPATSLPWHSYETAQGPNRYRVGDNQFAVAHIAATGRLKDDKQTADYIAHAANAYQKLVEALRSTLGALEADASRETDPQMRYYAECHHQSVAALLRELGESS